MIIKTICGIFIGVLFGIFITVLVLALIGAYRDIQEKEKQIELLTFRLQEEREKKPDNE